MQARQSCAIYERVDMILFDLKCGKGHVFEAWFRDGGTAERQIAGRKVSCPDCGATNVAKAPMAPRIGKTAPLSAAQREMAVKAAELRKGLKELRAKVEANCDYVGAGYGIPTEGMGEAVRMVAREEGILLDPVYSGKAMAGLIDLIRKGVLIKGETVVFLHTGGAVGLFGYNTFLANAV